MRVGSSSASPSVRATSRDRCERYVGDDRHADLWLGLAQTFHLLNDDDAAHELGLAALGGELFSSLTCEDMVYANCDNAQLLSAIRHLSTFQDGKERRRVNYAGLEPVAISGNISSTRSRR